MRAHLRSAHWKIYGHINKYIYMHDSVYFIGS